jgi:predicted MPP superfamily phosphohydrolase
MSFRIQYVSDIHLETYCNSGNEIFERILKPSAPYLALCGDIGYPDSKIYEDFLKYCSDNFEAVFYIAGNHEFYNDMKSINFLKIKDKMKKDISEDEYNHISRKFPRNSIDDRICKIKEICLQFPNIHFLDRGIYHVPNTKNIIIGCTLWSQLKMDSSCYYMFQDFKRICQDKDTLLTPTRYNQLFQEDLEFIRNTITNLEKTNPAANIIMLTHHCPTYDIIIDRYRLNDPANLNSFFANDDLISQFAKNIKVWICGHTHGCNKIKIGETYIATNVFGYENEIVDGFRNDAIIEF